MDEAEEEEIIADEPGGEVQGCSQCHGGIVGLEQACEVWDLEDVEDAVYGVRYVVL